MKQLKKRGEALARARRERAIGIIAARLREELRGIQIEVDQAEIRISGAGLFKRWLTETQLRFVGGLVK